MTLPFKSYLVGGAVRDRLLGRPVTEQDFVVVGATPKALLALGFQQVGKHFPVFLHPETKAEYALARKEIKTAKGYQGFEFDTSPTISLETDLMRRDLTINAMAMDESGKIIDPFGGQADLDKKILRHVSQAFKEDPVRVLRIARFAARFPDFTVAPETRQLMKDMLDAGEIDALVPDRVWKEWEKALTETKPEQFYCVLAQCGALSRIFPMFSAYCQAPFEKSPLYQLAQISQGSADPSIRFAATLSPLNGDEITALQATFPLPKHYAALLQLSHQLLDTLLQTTPLCAAELLHCLLSADAFRREARFFDLLDVAKHCARYRHPTEPLPMNLALLAHALQAANTIEPSQLINQSMSNVALSGENIASLIHQARLQAITDNLCQHHGLTDL